MLGEAGGSSRRLLPVLTASTMAAWRCRSAGAYRVGSRWSEGGFGGISSSSSFLYISSVTGRTSSPNARRFDWLSVLYS